MLPVSALHRMLCQTNTYHTMLCYLIPYHGMPYDITIPYDIVTMPSLCCLTIKSNAISKPHHIMQYGKIVHHSGEIRQGKAILCLQWASVLKDFIATHVGRVTANSSCKTLSFTSSLAENKSDNCIVSVVFIGLMKSVKAKIYIFVCCLPLKLLRYQVQKFYDLLTEDQYNIQHSHVLTHLYSSNSISQDTRIRKD